MKRLGLGLLTSIVAAAVFAPLAAFVPPAHAADLPVGPMAPAPAPVYRPALYDWTGIYFGGHAGAAFLDDQYNQTGVPTTVLTGPIDIHPAGFIGGGQAGANYEFAPWVIGIEGSWTVTTAFSGTSTVGTTTGGGVTEVSTTSPQWLAAATGRVGYAADSLLFYVKGGAAWMNVNYRQALQSSGITGVSQTITDTRSGFTAGIGLEYGLTENFSARLEYDYYGFGTQTYNAFAQTPVSIKSNMQTVAFGLNYRFNWAGGRSY